MEAKLVKEYRDFYLISNKEIQNGDEYVKLGNRPRTLLLGTTIPHVTKVPKLSLKNCQAIENGYDLDELADEYFRSVDSVTVLWRRIDFKKGFQKALSILGDKKFSEEDLNLAFLLGKNKDESRIGKLINSRLQQTEWDVEIVGSGTVYKTVLDCCANYHPKFGCSKKDGCSCINNELPKLDADGCIILKCKI